MSDSERFFKEYVLLVDEIEKAANKVEDTNKRQEIEQLVQDMRSKIEKKKIQDASSALKKELNQPSPEVKKQPLDLEDTEPVEVGIYHEMRARKKMFEAAAKAKDERAERLGELFDKPNGKSQANLARFCQVSTAAVALWVKKGAFTYDNAVKIANFFGVNPEWLFFGRGDKMAVPVAHKVKIADNRFAVFDIEIRRSEKWWKIQNKQAPVAFNQDFLGEEAIFAETCRLIRAQGDRMAPTIKAGEYLLVNEAEKAVISGSVYAVSVNGEFLLCQITRITDGIRLYYANPDYPDEEFTNEIMNQVSIIGRVVMSVRQF